MRCKFSEVQYRQFHLGGTMPRQKRTEAVDQLNHHSLMNETIHNNAFVILGHLVLKNGHLYTYKVLVLITYLLNVRKTLKFPPVVLILGWILLVYVHDLCLFCVTFPLLKL